MRVIGQKVRLKAPTTAKPAKAMKVARSPKIASPVKAKASGAMGVDPDLTHMLPGKPGHYNYS